MKDCSAMKTWLINGLLCLWLLASFSLPAQDAGLDGGFGIELEAGAGATELKTTAAVAGGKLQVTYAIPAGYHMVKQEEFVTFSIVTPGYRLGRIAYPAGHRNAAANDEEYTGTVTLPASLERTIAADQAAKTLEIKVAWQICDATGTCLPPADTTLKIAIDPATIPEAASPPAAGPGPVRPAASPPAAAGGQLPLWVLLAFAFLGGLILNAMPCVLPVLSIKALSLVESSKKDPREVLKGALAYTAGILACFAVLAGLVIALKLAGKEVGWGFQFQDWRFVLGLTVLVWLFALSLFEVFTITLPGMNAANNASLREGHLGSFISGMVAVLLATPCTAPMLGTALGFAFAQSPVAIAGFFLLIGLGLASPFLLLGCFPAALKLIPRPGNWMIIFREAMAFLLAGTVIYLLDILYHQIGNGLFGVLWYLLGATIAAWLYGKFANEACPAGRRWLFSGLAAIILLAPLPRVIANGNAAISQEQAGNLDPESGFLRFSPELVEQELAAKRPVFIDFGARWCATCRANEATVVYTETIRNAFKQHGVTAIRADYTNQNPVITEWLKRYHRAGVPLYLLFRPGEAQPHVFPELLTKDMVLAELAKLKR
jgi:thiol:disulfide interchange protein DsbD